MRPRTIVVMENGAELTFSFDEMVRYNGGGSPGGVAHAFKVLERALPLLSDGAPVERREITVHTAFAGPGARDTFELVTRAFTGGRYHVDQELRRPGRGRARERFVFRLTRGRRVAMLAVREGYVSDEFVDLAGLERRSPEQERRLTEMKEQMAEQVMASAAENVYELA